MAKKKVARKKAGRPKGSANKVVDTLEVDASRCGRCGSTRRTKYTNHRKISISGVTRSGRIYDKVVWRRTKCLNCGQWRDDKTFESDE